MQVGKIIKKDFSQSVQLPKDLQFSEEIKKVFVRKLGKERILTPIENTWDSFFLSKEKVTDDFLPERASQEQQDRDSF